MQGYTPYLSERKRLTFYCIDSHTASFKVNGTEPHTTIATKMAFSLFKRKSNTITISDYTIKIENNNGHVVGQGAHGIVYKAVDRYNETVAAKTIDGKYTIEY